MRRSSGGQNTKAGNASAEREVIESLTWSFDGLVRKNIGQDPEFAAALRREITDCIREGDLKTARDMLRDYFDEDLVTDQPETTAAAL
jgi:hypothetical protein